MVDLAVSSILKQLGEYFCEQVLDCFRCLKM